MVASNYRRGAPFITYLTLFQSRTASTNIILQLTSTAHQSIDALERKIVSSLTRKTEIDVKKRQELILYLRSKKFLGKEHRTDGRYQNLAIRENEGLLEVVKRDGAVTPIVSVYDLDIWMADPRIRSTVSVPTPENVREIVELCYALNVLSPTLRSWTAAGLVAVQLRTQTTQPESNPFVLGPELILILRQLIERDGIMLNAMLDKMHTQGDYRFLRDKFALYLPEMTRAAFEFAKAKKYSTESLHDGKEFLKLIENTSKNRAKMSTAPGVLEHRVTPRLEWLTDLGALSKEGLAKNGFEYKLTEDARLLQTVLIEWREGKISSDDSAIKYWRESTMCTGMRGLYKNKDPRKVLAKGYMSIRRPIGPVAIRDVCFIAAMMLNGEEWNVSALEKELLEWAIEIKGISLSGGRYKREPEFIHIRDDVVQGVEK